MIESGASTPSILPGGDGALSERLGSLYLIAGFQTPLSRRWVLGRNADEDAKQTSDDGKGNRGSWVGRMGCDPRRQPRSHSHKSLESFRNNHNHCRRCFVDLSWALLNLLLVTHRMSCLVTISAVICHPPAARMASALRNFSLMIDSNPRFGS